MNGGAGMMVNEISDLTSGAEAIKANLASLNEIIAEITARIAGDTDPEFAALARGILRGHSFALGFEFQGERGAPSADYDDPVFGRFGGRDPAAEDGNKEP
jgi:hypothetical protein